MKSQAMAAALTALVPASAVTSLPMPRGQNRPAPEKERERLKGNTSGESDCKLRAGGRSLYETR